MRFHLNSSTWPQANMAALIRSKIEGVAQDPLSAQGVKKLSGREEYRLRIGDWRMLYLLDGQRLRVLVTDVGPRVGIYQ
ncbi:MAG: type II toxin-antitoxin system RelE/ParE family toxin [Betaproteobacteria bacterium]|nr:type II toxin-antitoxin system RelE/ParE family toxin [Betaproteobacteria bacterium]